MLFLEAHMSPFNALRDDKHHCQQSDQLAFISASQDPYLYFWTSKADVVPDMQSDILSVHLSGGACEQYPLGTYLQSQKKETAREKKEWRTKGEPSICEVTGYTTEKMESCWTSTKAFSGFAVASSCRQEFWDWR